MPKLVSDLFTVNGIKSVGFPIAAFCMIFYGLLKPQNAEQIEVSRQMRASMAELSGLKEEIRGVRLEMRLIRKELFPAGKAVAVEPRQENN